jgi:hypothetical protein
MLLHFSNDSADTALKSHLSPIDKIGGRTRTRTWDPLIKSKVLSPVSKRHHTTATDADPHFVIEFLAFS